MPQLRYSPSVENSCLDILGFPVAELVPLLNEGVAALVLDVLNEDVVELRAVGDLALNSTQVLLRLALGVSVDAMALTLLLAGPRAEDLHVESRRTTVIENASKLLSHVPEIIRHLLRHEMSLMFVVNWRLLPRVARGRFCASADEQCATARRTP